MLNYLLYSLALFSLPFLLLVNCVFIVLKNLYNFSIYAIYVVSFNNLCFNLQLVWNFLVENSFCPWIMLFKNNLSYKIFYNAETAIALIKNSKGVFDFLLTLFDFIFDSFLVLVGPVFGLIVMFYYIYVIGNIIEAVIYKWLNKKN